MQRGHSGFGRFSKWASRTTGRPVTFVVAVSLVLLWAVTGPLFGFSDTWQLVINTLTTVTTFLMVFIIQNTQNRDTGAIQIKLDEVIRSLDRANKALLDLEELDDEEIEHIRSDYEHLSVRARDEIRKGRSPKDDREPKPKRRQKVRS
jgi:low affinity Fe/Cu permease